MSTGTVLDTSTASTSTVLGIISHFDQMNSTINIGEPTVLVLPISQYRESYKNTNVVIV